MLVKDHIIVCQHIACFTSPASHRLLQNSLQHQDNSLKQYYSSIDVYTGWFVSRTDTGANNILIKGKAFLPNSIKIACPFGHNYRLVQV